MIEEKLESIEFKYLYTKRFVWAHPVMVEEYQGHPIQGRVYRDIFNPQTKNHKIILVGTEGLGLPTLVGSTDLSDFEFKEITLETILDFEIKEEDLDLLNGWIESGNSDIKAMYQPLNKLTQALHSHEEDEAEALARATESLLHLWNINSLKFDIVVNLINYLAEADLNSYSDVANHIRHHPTQGKGVNITQALRALDHYNSDDRRSGEDLSDLYVAIEAMVVELERKIENNLID